MFIMFILLIRGASSISYLINGNHYRHHQNGRHRHCSCYCQNRHCCLSGCYCWLVPVLVPSPPPYVLLVS